MNLTKVGPVTLSLVRGSDVGWNPFPVMEILAPFMDPVVGVMPSTTKE